MRLSYTSSIERFSVDEEIFKPIKVDLSYTSSIERAFVANLINF